jgi:hypothetical protein
LMEFAPGGVTSWKTQAECDAFEVSELVFDGPQAPRISRFPSWDTRKGTAGPGRRLVKALAKVELSGFQHEVEAPNRFP